MKKKSPVKIPRNTPFKAKCPSCKKTFELNLQTVSGGSNDCDMCGAHSYISIRCPHCPYSFDASEI